MHAPRTPLRCISEWITKDDFPWFSEKHVGHCWTIFDKFILSKWITVTQLWVMPRFTTDRVPHCCSLETRQSQGTSCSAEITQTEEMRIQKGCLQWQQMVLNNSEYLWVIPHSRDVSRDWHPATLCARKLPMHPRAMCNGCSFDRSTPRERQFSSYRL